MKKTHLALLLSLYITQFLGLGFFTEAFIAILRKQGMALEHLGLVYMLGLFWVVRFLWAPLVDKIRFKYLGHLRGWLFLSQGAMALTLFIIASFSLQTQLSAILAGAVAFAFFSATQDIAVDALVFKSLSQKERPLGNALKISGGLIGTLLGGGVGLIVYTYIGWFYTFLLLAFSTTFSLLQLFFLKEPPYKAAEKGLALKTCLSFWKGKKEWFLLILTYPVSISTAYSLTTPILVDSGWALDKIGLVVHVVGYGIGILASFTSSYFMRVFGHKKVLVFAAFGQAFGVLLLLLPLNGFNNDVLVMSVVGIIFMFYTPSATIISTLMMEQIEHKHLAASLYAMQHSINMFSGIFFASLSVSLAGSFGYEVIISISVCIALLAMLQASRFNTSFAHDKQFVAQHA